jgi:hypothetical protein
MSAILALALLCQAATADTSSGSPSPSAASQGTQPATPSRDLAGAVLADAIQNALRRWSHPVGGEATKAAQELLPLYQQLLRDTTLAASQRDSLRIRLRYRLLDLANQINARAAHEARIAANAPASVKIPADRSANLAQVGPANPGAGIGPPAMMASDPEDGGDQLVDLIQKTIAPASWDVNGGQGVIRLWRPGKALVIRQSTEVHEGLNGLVGQLQQAGR